MNLLFLLITSTLMAAPSKIQPFLTEKMSEKMVQIPILVYLKDTADLNSISTELPIEQKRQAVYDLLRTTAIQSQAAVRSLLDSKGLFYKAFYITNVIAIDSADANLIQELAARSDVRKVSYNPTVKMDDLQPSIAKIIEEITTIESSLVYVGADKVWSQFGIKGKGIVVAGQDTGVQWNHPALINQYRGSQLGVATNHNYNWHDAIHRNSGNNSCGANLVVPCDDNEHGTHTIGTIVGDDGANNQIGMAPEAEWIACRNMDAGFGTPATYIECFEFFMAPYPLGGNAMEDGDTSKAPHVINNSWGCPASEGCEGPEFIPVLQALETAGIMVVVSAGNDGSGCRTLGNPAHVSANVLSVGALNHTSGLIASFSSRGPSRLDGGVGPGVAAPGVNIRSAIPGNQYAQFGWSGTSMAGPHVAGQVALMWSANPKLIGKIQKTKDLIYQTAKAKSAPQSCGEAVNAVPNNTYGYGIIDTFAAVKAALAAE
jgi:serine protease AprX